MFTADFNHIHEMLIRLADVKTIIAMVENNDLSEKKLRGSGGYVLAKITEGEQKRGNLGGPDLFLAGVGRLAENRFTKYYCNKCEKEYPGCPKISYEIPNEDLGEGITLLETGEYKCAGCNNTISQYRKFKSPEVSTDVIGTMKQQNSSRDGEERNVPFHRSETNAIPITSNEPFRSFTSDESKVISNSTRAKGVNQEGFVPIQSLMEMPVYDSEAILVGRVLELGLRKSSDGKMELSMKINTENQPSNLQYTEVLWKNILKIGDIIVLSVKPSSKNEIRPKCSSCGYENEGVAVYCEECGKKLV